MSRLNSTRLIISLFSSILLFTNIKGFSSEHAVQAPETLSREDFILELLDRPVSEIPDYSSHPGSDLEAAIDTVKSGSVFMINNKYTTRVFYDGELPEDLSSIRIVTVSSIYMPQNVYEGHWNTAINEEIDRNVEISNTKEQARIINFVNEYLDRANAHNIHQLADYTYTF